ncbi:MAG TPA: hypothetical protein VGO93_27315 [Candidatus Xenobia bacterium]|jgi:hypothetical protein
MATATMHLTDYNESERADYMVVVAAMASHGGLTSEELMVIRELCMRYVLGPDARGRVMAASNTPPHDLEHTIKHLGHTRLKHSLFVDICVMGFVHGSPNPAALVEIQHIADLLGLSKPEVDAVEKLAALLSPANQKPASEPQVEKALETIEQAGVPHGAIALSATLMSLHNDEHAPVKEALSARHAKTR